MCRRSFSSAVVVVVVAAAVVFSTGSAVKKVVQVLLVVAAGPQPWWGVDILRDAQFYVLVRLTDLARSLVLAGWFAPL